MIHLMSLLTMDVFVLLRDLDSTPPVFTPWSWCHHTRCYIYLHSDNCTLFTTTTWGHSSHHQLCSFPKIFLSGKLSFEEMSVMCWLLSSVNMTLGWRHDSWCLEFHSKSQIWQYWNYSQLSAAADTFILFNLTFLEWQLFSTILAGLGFILKH